MQVFGQHVAARRDADDDQTAENKRQRARSRDAERERRDQRAAFLGVGRGIDGDHAADIALAETFPSTRAGLLGAAIGEPVGDRGAEPRYDAYPDSDHAAAENQPLVIESIFDSLSPAGSQIGERQVRNAGSLDAHIEQFRNGEQTDGDWDQFEAIDQE